MEPSIWSQATYKELKLELGRRGLVQSGKKAELLARLNKYVEENEGNQNDVTEHSPANTGNTQSRAIETIVRTVPAQDIGVSSNCKSEDNEDVVAEASQNVSLDTDSRERNLIVVECSVGESSDDKDNSQLRKVTLAENIDTPSEVSLDHHERKLTVTSLNTPNDNIEKVEEHTGDAHDKDERKDNAQNNVSLDSQDQDERTFDENLKDLGFSPKENVEKAQDQDDRKLPSGEASATRMECTLDQDYRDKIGVENSMEENETSLQKPGPAEDKSPLRDVDHRMLPDTSTVEDMDICSDTEVDENIELVESEEPIWSSSGSWIQLVRPQNAARSEKINFDKFSTETKYQDIHKTRTNRRVTAFPIMMEDLSDPHIQSLIKDSNHASLDFSKALSKNNEVSMAGTLNIILDQEKDVPYCLSVLQNFKPDLILHHKSMNHRSSSFHAKVSLSRTHSPSSPDDNTVLIPDLPQEFTEQDLWTMFPTAWEIILMASASSESTTSVSTSGSSYAYIYFPNASILGKAFKHLEKVSPPKRIIDEIIAIRVADLPVLKTIKDEVETHEIQETEVEAAKRAREIAASINRAFVENSKEFLHNKSEDTDKDKEKTKGFEFLNEKLIKQTLRKLRKKESTNYATTSSFNLSKYKKALADKCNPGNQSWNSNPKRQRTSRWNSTEEESHFIGDHDVMSAPHRAQETHYDPFKTENPNRSLHIPGQGMAPYHSAETFRPLGEMEGYQKVQSNEGVSDKELGLKVLGKFLSSMGGEQSIDPKTVLSNLMHLTRNTERREAREDSRMSPFGERDVDFRPTRSDTDMRMFPPEEENWKSDPSQCEPPLGYSDPDFHREQPHMQPHDRDRQQSSASCSIVDSLSVVSRIVRASKELKERDKIQRPMSSFPPQDYDARYRPPYNRNPRSGYN